MQADSKCHVEVRTRRDLLERAGFHICRLRQKGFNGGLGYVPTRNTLCIQTIPNPPSSILEVYVSADTSQEAP